MKTVLVLMAAYNGEAYLRQQIDSILNQKGVRVSLLIRDDGSCDGTREILQQYAQKFENVSFYTGTRLGASKSFFDLMLHAGLSDDYYAFSDQDDFWMRDKLAHAAALLERGPAGQPLLYAGKVIYASQDLKKREPFSYKINKKASFGNALMENICMGCTEVFNKPLLMLAREHLPRGNEMHDWWMYLTASYFGRVIFSQKAYMLYRQHGNNEIGMQNRWGMRWKNRMMHVRQMKHRLSKQAAEFEHAYAQVVFSHPACCRELWLLSRYRNHFLDRFRIAANKNIYRQNPLDDIICRLLFLFGFL